MIRSVESLILCVVSVLHDIRAVKLTGQNGSPVFARAQLEDGYVSWENDNLNHYLLHFPNSISNSSSSGSSRMRLTFHLANLLNAEVHMSHVRLWAH
jgi:hypothetical protein